MKGRKIISLVLSLVMLLSLAVVPASAAEAEEGKTFEDVQEHWGKDSVERWAGYGVLKGDETGAFNPDKSMTRAEFATMLVNLMGYTEKAENTFADVPADAWYADAVLKLAAAGVMQGDGVNANPNATISREETAVLLCRAMNITPSATASVDFADAGSVASWAQDAVAALVERGMIQGMGDNQFAPTLNITRASVAKMVDNMVAVYVVDEAQEITGEVKGVVIVAANADVTVKDATLAENLIVAPKAAGASVELTGNTVAQDVIVSASGANLKVEKDAKATSVVADAPEAGVAVAGTVGEVKSTAAAEGSSLTVEKGAKVETVVTNAPKGSVAVNESVKSIVAGENATEGTVEVAKGVTVDTLTTDAPIKVDNKGTVKKAEVNTSDVVIDGNAPKELDVPKGVDKPTDSKGEEIKDKPSTGGGSSGGNDTPSTPTYKYTASVVKVGNGTVSIAPANSNDAGTEVTITVQADPGWKVGTVELTTKPSESAAAVSNNKFTMDKEGAYTVTVTFVQPLSKFEVDVFDNADSAYAWLTGTMGFTLTREEYNTAFGSIEREHPWLFIAGKRGTGMSDGFTTSNISFKVNGVAQNATWGNYTGNENGKSNVLSLFVDDSGKANEDELGFTGDAATIEVSVKYQELTYTASCQYTKSGVTAHTLTFTDPDGGNATVTYTVANNGSQNAPSALTREGYTFQNWKLSTSDATVAAGTAISGVTADATYVAQWEENTYTIAFDDGTDDTNVNGTMMQMGNVKYSEAKELTANGFTRTGYTFKGWDTDSSADEVVYGDKATVSKLSTVNGATVSLYAVWEVKPATTLAELKDQLTNVTIPTITLGASFGTDEKIVVSRTVILDLNGKKLTATGNISAIEVRDAGKLTVKDSGTAGEIACTGNKATIRVFGDNSYSDRQKIESTLIVAGGKISGREGGVSVFGLGATLIVNDGTIIATDNAAVSGNGTVNASKNEDDGGTSITINGGLIEGQTVSEGYRNCGLYHPQAGELIIKGGTIQSTNGAGLVIRSGSLNMTGGTLIGKGTGGADCKMGDAIPTFCAGLEIGYGVNYPGGMGDISVSGGTIQSEYANPVLQVGSKTGTGTVSISVGTLVEVTNQGEIVSPVALLDVQPEEQPVEDEAPAEDEVPTEAVPVTNKVPVEEPPVIDEPPVDEQPVIDEVPVVTAE